MVCRWTLSGTKRTIDQKIYSLIDQSACILEQHIITAFRSDRQVTYQPKASSKFQTQIKTSLSINSFALNCSFVHKKQALSWVNSSYQHWRKCIQNAQH